MLKCHSTSLQVNNVWTDGKEEVWTLENCGCHLQ